MYQPPLWSDGNIISSHAASPGLIPRLLNFLVEVFSEVFSLDCQKIYGIGIILFNDGHILHQRSELIAIHRWMNMVLDDYDGHMTPWDDCDLNFQTFVLQMRKNPGKILNQEIDTTRDPNQAYWMRGQKT